MLYPFGYGLSYSKFRYDDIKISPQQWNADEPVTVSIDVTNTGTMDADEVVQLYASRTDIQNSPIRTLVGFERIHLRKGETKKITFQLDDRSLSTVNAAGQRTVVPGAVTLWVGGGQPGQRTDLPAAPGKEASFSIKKSKVL